MEETKFEKVCGINSFYVSLEEQKQTTSTVARDLRSSRRLVSKDSASFVHFILEHESHWAAIQIVISPFTLKSYPGQQFYSCQLHYALGCQRCSAPEGDGPSIDLISTSAQRIYDIFYRPGPWDFLVRDWYVFTIPKAAYMLRICSCTFDLCPNPTSDEDTCAEGAERMLLAYIQTANESQHDVLCLSEDSDTGEPARKSKRRKLDHNEPVLRFRSNPSVDDSGADDSSAGDSSEVTNETSEEPSEEASEEASDERSDDTSVDDDCGVEVRSKTSSAPKMEPKLVTAKSIAKKIMTGITKMFENGNRGGSMYQPQLPSSHISTFHAETCSSSDQGYRSEQLKILEETFWHKATTLLQNSKAEAWRYKFIAACLCNMRGSNVVEKGKERGKWRWVRAVRVINSIVNGLWHSWGPGAALVYEALAGTSLYLLSIKRYADERLVMNYSVYSASELSRTKQEELLSAVVETLASESIPWPQVDFLVLHPASCISSGMGIM
jgi:hypothetical protein